MKTPLFILLFLPLYFSAQLSPEQEAKVDSLRQVIKTAQHDSVVVNSLSHWDNIIYLSDPKLDYVLNVKVDSICDINLKKNLSKKEEDFFLESKSYALNVIGLINEDLGNLHKANEYFSKSLKIFKKIGSKHGIATALNNIGNTYQTLGDLDQALEYYSNSMEIYDEIGYKKGVSSSLNNIGIIYKIHGDYSKAIEYYTKSLKIKEEQGDKNGIANSFENIGTIYSNQGDLNKANNYFSKCLKIYEEVGNKAGIASSFEKIGSIYDLQGNTKLAHEHYSKSMKICKELEQKEGIASNLNNIGNLHNDNGDIDLAFEYFSKSLKLYEEIEDKISISNSLNNIGIIYEKRGSHAKAYEFCKRALLLAREAGAVEKIEDAAKSLWKINKELGKHGSSLEMYELYIVMKDSIQNEETQKEIIRQELKYNYEKKEAVAKAKHEAIMQQQEAEALAEQEQQSIIIWSVSIGLILVALFLLFVFSRLRITRKQKNEINNQKEMIEEAHKEITDSIIYAKRIQKAILPPERLIKKYLNDSFVLYKPKDVIAGDFFWIQSTNDQIIFAAADCTGHGVPGAIVSVICNHALNRAVREFKLLEPGPILDKARELVIKEFEKSVDNVKDGMDIALCSINGQTLKYAGANNPLLIVRDQKVLTTKADKQPIGKRDRSHPFTTHTMELEKGDAIYVFSDGFADQFGGKKNKKFKMKSFKELLLNIQKETMVDQKAILNSSFDTWKGDFEQIDDVCVFGVRVN